MRVNNQHETYDANLCGQLRLSVLCHGAFLCMLLFLHCQQVPTEVLLDPKVSDGLLTNFRAVTLEDDQLLTNYPRGVQWICSYTNYARLVMFSSKLQKTF